MALSESCKRAMNVALASYGMGAEVSAALDANTLKTSYTSTHNTWMNAVPVCGDTDSLELQVTKTLSAAASDGYAAALRLDPGYSGSSLTRHNYIDLQTPSTSGMTISNAAVFRCDANFATHPALGTDTSAVLSGCVYFNANGTIFKLLAYSAA